MARMRLDLLLVKRGFVESRHRAQAMVMAGEVLVDGQKAEKPGRQVRSDVAIRLVRQKPRFVSRAGFKLEAALEHFRIDVEGAVCLDIGASTGGFTDCLLQHGADRVHAVDVGVGQLHWRIRCDQRVIVREKLNARNLLFDDVGEIVDFVCCDVSFISVTKILPRIPKVLRPGGPAVVLAKPQFEVGKGEVGKGGIVRDPAQHRRVVETVSAAMAECGFESVGSIRSPIRGASGNREFLVHGRHRLSPEGEGA